MVLDKKKVLAQLKKGRDLEESEKLEKIKNEKRLAKRLAELERSEKRRAEVIEIREEEFNNSESFRLLKRVIKDAKREGVKCTQRLRHSLAENLRNPQHKDKYGVVAKSLKYKDGKVRTTISLGKISIIYKEHKK